MPDPTATLDPSATPTSSTHGGTSDSGTHPKHGSGRSAGGTAQDDPHGSAGPVLPDTAVAPTAQASADSFSHPILFMLLLALAFGALAVGHRIRRSLVRA